jgi:hypothetical protein
MTIQRKKKKDPTKQKFCEIGKLVLLTPVPEKDTGW